MGVQILTKASSYQDIANELLLPVKGAIGIYLGKEANLGKNLAPSGIKPNVVGNPPQTSEYAQGATANDYIETNIDLQNLESYTIINVHAKPTTIASGFETAICSMNEVQTKLGGWMAGRGLFYSGSVLYGQYNYLNSATTQVNAPLTLSSAEMSDIGAYVQRISKDGATVKNTLLNLTKNIKKETIVTDVYDAKTGSNTRLKLLREGDRQRSTTTQTFSSSYYVTLIYDRALGDDEIEVMHEWVKKYCASRGITLN